MLEEVAERLDLEMEFIRIADDYQVALRSGEVDVAWGNISVAEEPPDGLRFSRPYLKTNQVAVVARDSGIEKKEDLDGKRFVAVRWTPGDYLVNSDALDVRYSRASTFRNYLTPFDSMQRDSATVVICDETLAEFMLGELGDDFIILTETLYEVRYAAAFRMDDTQIWENVESVLEAIGADGTGEQLSQQWFGKNLYITQH